jgi:hypothetical protein
MQARLFRRKQAGEKPVFVPFADKIETVGLRLFLRRRGLQAQGRAPAAAVVLAGASATASERAPSRIKTGEAMKIEE